MVAAHCPSPTCAGRLLLAAGSTREAARLPLCPRSDDLHRHVFVANQPRRPCVASANIRQHTQADIHNTYSARSAKPYHSYSGRPWRRQPTQRRASRPSMRREPPTSAPTTSTPYSGSSSSRCGRDRGWALGMQGTGKLQSG